MASGERGKRPVRVTIYNQSYNLLATGEPGLTESLAQYVDELMNNIAQKIGGTDSTRVAVLAGLHLADRINSLERELEAVKERVAILNQQCDSLLGAGRAVESDGDAPQLEPSADDKAGQLDDEK